MNHEKSFEAIYKLKDIEIELHRLKNALEMANKALDAQRTWVGLTYEDIERIKLLTFEKEINTNGEEQEAVNLDQLIRAAEQLCKEKNYE